MTIGRAVVIGGSMAGLSAAACLARHAQEVLIIERNQAADGCSVVPHGGLPHVMLAAGGLVLQDLVPGIVAELIAGGADTAGDNPGRIPGRWAAAGAVRDHIALPGHTGPTALCSRGLIESRLRAAALSLPNVSLVGDVAHRLDLAAPLRVVGVHLRDAGLIEADVVVDATGRAAPLVGTPQVPAPPTDEVVVDVRYTCFLVERRPGDFDDGSFAVVQNTRDIRRGAVAVPDESGAWHVGLSGYFGDHAPADAAGARAFAAALADPALASLFDRPFLATPRRYHFRSSLRRHWERLPQHVEGYVPIGDTVASFNPVYAQGMSSALLQAQALGRTVEQYGAGSDLSRRMAKECARVVAAPWTMATGADFMYPETRGRRPLGQAVVNTYVDRLLRAAAVDERVNAAFSQVQQLVAPPSTLFAPGVVAAVLRSGRPVEPAGSDGPLRPFEAVAPQARQPSGG